MNISFILAYFSQCYDKVNLRVEVFILVQSKKGVAAGVWGSWPNTLSVVRKDSDEFCMLNLNSQNPRLWNDAGPHSGGSSYSVKSFWRCVSLVILNPIELTVKINHPGLEHPKG
jgi:hypothetical protein